jgi:hypothetical protein
VLKQLELLEQRKFEDEDIQQDIEYLVEKLEASVQVETFCSYFFKLLLYVHLDIWEYTGIID